MGTKMKGLLKGLRYISQIFDDEKEQEIQIGNPTDVKHVAHIGWDGPAVESPSWMKDFESPSEVQSGPLGNIGDSKENPAVSQDSNRSRASNSSLGDAPEVVVKSTRRHHSSSGDKSESPKKDPSRRHSRRNHSKESGEHSVKSVRQPSDSTATGLESPSRNLPDIPKKSRRKKSKENLSTGVSSKPLRSKDTAGDGAGAGAGGGSVKTRRDEVSQASSMKNPTQEEGVGCSDVSWTS